MDTTTLNWAFKTLLSGVFVYAVRILAKLEKSVEALNIKMAVTVEQISGHEKRLNTLESEEKKRKFQ